VCATEQPPYAQAQIIEHTTKQGKTLRGIVRHDLDQAAAKAIDHCAFRKNGGWFIREKHLAGAQTAATKIDATQAQAQTGPAPQKSAPTATPAALQKMRDTAARTIADAQIELARERNTNTHRRARIANSIEARERAKSALGETMLALADAIQAGQAPALTKATTLAAVTLLEESHRADRQTLPATEWGAATNPIALATALRQKSAYALANYIEMHGSITPETWRDLKTHLTEAQLQGHLGWWNVAQIKKINAWARLGVTTDTQMADALAQYRAARKNPRQADPIAAAERALIGQKIGVDFFPTPAALAQKMAELANIQPGQKVIEPSAGSGNLAQAAREAGAHVDCWEISSTLRDLLALKGFTLAGHDFTEATPAPIYDAVLMNPPFSNRQDADHIQRAHAMLKPGGCLVAIAGEGVFNGQDAKAAQFRDWLTAQNAQVQKLPPGTFNAPGLLATTQANARMIIIHK
jgi:phospholipid N-methyltransferase